MYAVNAGLERPLELPSLRLARPIGHYDLGFVLFRFFVFRAFIVHFGRRPVDSSPMSS